jgi:hypothetical protein
MSYSHMIVAFGETSSTRDVWMDVAGSDGGVARTCKLQLPVRLQFPVLTLDLAVRVTYKSRDHAVTIGYQHNFHAAGTRSSKQRSQTSTMQSGISGMLSAPIGAVLLRLTPINSVPGPPNGLQHTRVLALPAWSPRRNRK